jgi:antitoxin MazE7
VVTATTIKVPPQLRDRVNRDASELGLSAAQLIEQLIDAYERERRLDAFGRAFASADDMYRAETEDWAVVETAWPVD